MPNNKVSVILPTFNEKENAVSLIKAIHDELEDYDHEIIVVDDDSRDGTYQAVLDLKLPFVKAILRTENHGLACSIRCGIENASGEYFIVMDADWQHRPEYVSIMAWGLSNYDCVLGSRFIYGGRMANTIRHILSNVFNIFTRMMTGGQITDNLYGFFGIRKSVIEKCNYDDVFWGYGDYCIRLMYCLQMNNASILQIPILGGVRRGGNAHGRFFQVFREYFVAVVKQALKGRLKISVFHRKMKGAESLRWHV